MRPRGWRFAFTGMSILVGLAATCLGATGSGEATSGSVTGRAKAIDQVIRAAGLQSDIAGMPLQEAALQNNVVTVHGSVDVEVMLPVSTHADSQRTGGLIGVSDTSSYSIVPAVLNDGSVAIHSILRDARAPRSFAYTLALPPGSSLRVDSAIGGAVAQDRQGRVIIAAARPWARDATGRALPTRYKANGFDLVQEVDVDAAAVYPVVADPWLGINLVDSYRWTSSWQGYRLNVNPTLWARGVTANPYFVAIGNAGWDELRRRIPSSQRGRLNESGKQQYVCHMGFAGFDPQWNLELWVKNKGLARFIADKCN